MPGIRQKVIVRAAVIAAINVLLCFGVLAQDNAPVFPTWSYSEERGPARWSEISDAFALCATGEMQSPVDIDNTTPSALGDVQFNYKPSKLTVVDAGYTVQVNYDEGSSVTFDGHTYMLKRIVFHTPSEHTIEGKRTRMEIQLVHEDAFGRMVIVSVLGERVRQNPSLRGVFNTISNLRAEPWTIMGVTFNAAEMLPPDLSYYSYMGSLTTPPCTEGVRWIILQTPIGFSRAQLTAFEERFGLNTRPVQRLNGREVVAG